MGSVKWIGVLARVVVGAVWVVAGALKLGDPAESVRAVRAYDLLPESLVPLVGHALPVLEIVVGVVLLLGLLTRWSAALSSLMLVAFIVGISSAWARGLSIDCGCFGGGGGPVKAAATQYPWDLARDTGLLLLSAFLVLRPGTPLSVDGVLLPEVPAGTSAAAAPATSQKRGRSAQQAAIRREAAAAAQRERNRWVSLGVGAALVVVVAVGASVQSGRDTTGVTTAAPAHAVDYAMPVGPASATTTVDIYEDFLCPYCGQFESLSGDLVERESAAGVLFRYHVISFLDASSSTKYSTRAANALAVVMDTAGTTVAKTFHDELYADQPQEGSAGLSDADLVDLAVKAGADRAAVTTPIADLKYAQWVKNGTDAASRAGVNGTPTVKVDGTALPQQAIPDLVADLESTIKAGNGS